MGAASDPRKAAEGYRLRILAIDEPSAEMVRQIFAEYLDGRGDRAIANGLNRDGIPCPRRDGPDQNRHRLSDGWQGSTVRSILENPSYTGYAFFGRWAKHETLLDPDDVAAGHVTRFRRSSPERVVRPRQPAHPAIVSVETFTEVQLLRRGRAAEGLAASRKWNAAPGQPSGYMRCAIGSGAGIAPGGWKERRGRLASTTDAPRAASCPVRRLWNASKERVPAGGGRARPAQCLDWRAVRAPGLMEALS